MSNYTSEKIKKKIERTIKVHQDSIKLIKKIKIATQEIIDSFSKGGKIIIMGNGGSATDASHMAAELVGRYKIERKALPAISITTDSAIITAIANDYDFEEVFTRQCKAVTKDHDIIMIISTSGNSKNVVKAATEIKKKKLNKIISLTGKSGGKLDKISDIMINVPSDQTENIQEVHRTIIHTICEIIDFHYAKK